MKTRVQPVAAMGRRLGLALALAGMSLLFAGTTSADPAVAAMYLQVEKNQVSLAELHFQIGKNYAIAGRASQAQTYFLQARMDALQAKTTALDLYAQNLDTLSRGQYRNLGYQQAAVAYSDQLRMYASVLDASLSVLVTRPLQAGLRVNAETALIQTRFALTQTEQAMLLAQ